MRRLATALTTALAAALCLLPSLGCEVVHSDLQLKWTFAGQTCEEVGIAKIRVSIDGERLVPDVFDCVVAGQVTTGVDLGRFLTGLYDVTVEGLDASGQSQLSVTQSVLVRNQPVNVVTIDLGIGSVVLDWTFDGQTCSQAGVSYLRISVDGQEITDERNDPNIPCSQSGHDGVVIEPLDAGTHVLDLFAYSGNTLRWSLSGLQVKVVLARPVTVYADLLSASGNSAAASLTWTFAGLSCARAQVDSVQVLVDDQDAGTVPCSSAGLDGAAVSPLSAGSHSFKLLASRGTGSGKLLVYVSTQGTTATFHAGFTLAVVLDAPTASPGKGGAVLRWKFPSGGPDCAASAGAGPAITVTLKDRAGTPLATQTATCGGAAGSTGVTFCDPTATSCVGGPALAAGAWTLDAAAGGAPAYAAHLVFGVPNAASGTYEVAFVAR